MLRHLGALSKRRSDGAQILGVAHSTRILWMIRDPIEELSKGRSARYKSKEKIV
jgi:hypothetical protein